MIHEEIVNMNSINVSKYDISDALFTLSFSILSTILLFKSQFKEGAKYVISVLFWNIIFLIDQPNEKLFEAHKIQREFNEKSKSDSYCQESEMKNLEKRMTSKMKNLENKLEKILSLLTQKLWL